MKKKILFISPGPNFNIHSQLFRSQYVELSSSFRGYIYTTSKGQEVVDIGSFQLFSMQFSNSMTNTIRFFIFCTWNAIKLLIKDERFDLVTTYDPLKTGLIGLVISRIHKAKFAPEVNGVYTSPAEWLDDIDSPLTKLKKIIYPKIMQFVLKRADGIRLLFRGQIDPLSNILKNKVVHNFHCFVPTEQFKNISEEKEVLFVGFPFKRKGVDILIDAFKEIASEFPEWKLKILGWFPNMGELSKAIDNHPQIYHHKPVNYEQMVEHIGKCAILVLPSRSEAMGRVLVEAMAAGKPRIGSWVDGIPTVIRDGIDGLLVEPESVPDLSEKLALLMSSSDLRKKLGSAGEKRVKKEFTKETYFKNLVNFYNCVLDLRMDCSTFSIDEPSVSTK